MRHDDIRNITADILTEVCPRVFRELTLQPLTDEQLQLLTANTEDEALADISAQRFEGTNSSVHFSMSGVQHSCIKLVQILRDSCVQTNGGHMSKGSLRLSMGSSCHWFFQQQVAWDKPRPCHTREWHLSWQRKGATLLQDHWLASVCTEFLFDLLSHPV